MPPACHNVLPHGDFELGILPPWDLVGAGMVVDMLPHSGTRSVRLGGEDNAWAELFAHVELPPDALSAELAFWWYVESTDPQPDVDVLTVLVVGPGGESVLGVLTNSVERDRWHHFGHDLSQFTGQPFALTFHIMTSGENPTSFYLDDVEVMMCMPPTGRWTLHLPLILSGA